MKNIFTHIPCEIAHLAQSYYQQGLRDYHDWDHIMDLMGKAYKNNIKLNEAQELAILFHDSVYIPGSIYNEKASVDLMRACIGKEIPNKWILIAERMILDTCDHIPRCKGSDIVSDLDMLVLSNELEFVDSHLKIYNEYRKLVPTYAEFMIHRKAWAKSLVDRDLYFSEKFKHLNPSAKQNLINFLQTE